MESQSSIEGEELYYYEDNSVEKEETILKRSDLEEWQEYGVDNESSKDKENGIDNESSKDEEYGDDNESSNNTEI